MEMCYDGALVLPSSYAVMDEEEMTYVEGGARIAAWIVGGAINIGITLLCGGISALCAKKAAGCFASASARSLFAKKLAKKLTAKGIAYSLASAITGAISYVLTFVSGILDPGNYIANYYALHDKHPDKYCDF